MSKTDERPIVALDTMTLIYALRRAETGDPELVELQKRAQITLSALDDEDCMLVVPAICVAELLIGVPENERSKFIGELAHQFVCPEFNVEAAHVAAELWTKHRGMPRAEQLRRTTLKADVMIIASAKCAGADRFYTHDKKCRKLARLAGLDARDLKWAHSNLFVDHKIRTGCDPNPS